MTKTNVSHIELNNEIMTRGADGWYQLDKDREAVDVFLAEVAAKSRKFPSQTARYRWLIDNGYYDDMLTLYGEAAVERIVAVCNSYGFRFASYMAASKFYKDYALKTDDKTE